jgi:hypothetical protein
MDIKRKKIIGLTFFQLFFLPIMAQDCSNKKFSDAPKEMTSGRFEPSGRISLGHPYTMFNTVDYPMIFFLQK